LTVVALAAGLLRLLRAPADRLAGFQTVDWTAALDWLHRTTGLKLASKQAAAVRLALAERVAVLTGGPGCGRGLLSGVSVAASTGSATR
jgi:exodeoxyribonuclease V alpha subunit